jgi:hypothetical protein
LVETAGDGSASGLGMDEKHDADAADGKCSAMQGNVWDLINLIDNPGRLESVFSIVGFIECK